MSWAVEFTEDALSDMKKLGNAERSQVVNAIDKVSINPLPQREGGYGKPLGNHLSAKLAGYFKIKLLKAGLRVIYGIVREKELMKIIVISVRDDETVYKEADRRIRKMEY